jgi:hypothetical protein
MPRIHLIRSPRIRWLGFHVMNGYPIAPIIAASPQLNGSDFMYRKGMSDLITTVSDPSDRKKYFSFTLCSCRLMPSTWRGVAMIYNSRTVYQVHTPSLLLRKYMFQHLLQGHLTSIPVSDRAKACSRNASVLATHSLRAPLFFRPWYIPSTILLHTRYKTLTWLVK